VKYGLIAFVAVVALAVLLSDLLATVSLIRTDQLNRFQKIAQVIIVWLVPFVGAWLVLHLIGQSDRKAILEWVPNTAISEYIFQMLGVEGRVATGAAESEIEQVIMDSLPGHGGHSGGAESGDDGGH
jgi:hypothetical protein